MWRKGCGYGFRVCERMAIVFSRRSLANRQPRTLGTAGISFKSSNILASQKTHFQFQCMDVFNHYWISNLQKIWKTQLVEN